VALMQLLSQVDDSNDAKPLGPVSRSHGAGVPIFREKSAIDRIWSSPALATGVRPLPGRTTKLACADEHSRHCPGRSRRR
jgi:hypothetical protein